MALERGVTKRVRYCRRDQSILAQPNAFSHSASPSTPRFLYPDARPQPGEVLDDESMEIVRKIESQKTDGRDKPEAEVKIVKSGEIPA